ncbi:hypothetical protein F2981_24185 (plasmid) [Sinorhizobium meliloti]|nr:hypothetical protein [Sinorhizobium meliloti]
MPLSASSDTLAAPTEATEALRWAKILLSEYFVLVLCVVYVAAIYPFVPEILSWEVASNILGDMMPLLVSASDRPSSSSLPHRPLHHRDHLHGGRRRRLGDDGHGRLSGGLRPRRSPPQLSPCWPSGCWSAPSTGSPS